MVGKAKTCAVIGIWHSDDTDSTGKNQNPGDVLVEVHAASVNPIDTMMIGKLHMSYIWTQ